MRIIKFNLDFNVTITKHSNQQMRSIRLFQNRFVIFVFDFDLIFFFSLFRMGHSS